jgi:hypothetical protein|tara:strand:+ start:4188 stop:4697 length:510 start_codon:yes stop_codon:yes gene_type:complete
MVFENLKEYKDIFVDKVSKKFSDLYEKDDEKEIEYKKVAKEKATEDVGEYDTLDTEGQKEFDVARALKIKEMRDAQRVIDEKEDKELADRLDAIKKVINTFEDFQSGTEMDLDTGYQDVADPYTGGSALSDLQEKENMKSLLSQITSYNNPMSRAVNLQKRMQNLIKYT